MKNSIHIIILTLLLITVGGMFGGCSSKQEAELRALEQWMDTNPDSVISVLENMDETALSNLHIRALHTMMLTRARDKSHTLHATVNNDSLIRWASEYLGRYGSEYDYMRSLFYAGLVNYHIGCQDEAMRYALKAEKLAEKRKDDYWMAKIAELQGFTYTETYNYKEELRARRKAAQLYHITGYELNSLFALMDIAYIYKNMEKCDMAVAMVDSVLPFIYKIRSSYLIGSAYHIYTLCSLEKNEYAKAEIYSDSVLKYWPDETRTSAVYISLALLRMNKNDSIGFFENIEIAKERSLYQGDSVFVFDALLRYYKKKNDYKMALDCEESIMKLNGRQIDGALEQSGTKVQREILRTEVKEREWEAHKREIMLWMLGVGALTLAVMLCLSVSYFRERIKRKDLETSVCMEKLSSDYLTEVHRSQTLEEQIEEIRTDMAQRDAKMKQEIAWLYKAQWSKINKLSTAYLNKKGTDVESTLLKDLEAEIRELGEPSSLQRFERVIDDFKDGLMSRFRSQCPELCTEKVLPMVILFYAQLTTGSISIILDTNLKTLYSRRKTLINKIQALAPEDAEEFIAELKG